MNGLHLTSLFQKQERKFILSDKRAVSTKSGHEPPKSHFLKTVRRLVSVVVSGKVLRCANVSVAQRKTLPETASVFED